MLHVCIVSDMIKIGLLLPTREAAINGDRQVSRLIDLARRTEALGLDSVWAGDSLTARPRVEPLTLLSAVAAATTTLEIGTAALTGALRQPLLAAHAITTLDLVSEGRLTQGRYWRFDGLAGLPAPSRPGGPALWLAGAGPRAVDPVGRLFDGWLPYLPEPEEYGRQRAGIEEVATAAGRDPATVTPALYVTVLPQHDPARARADLESYVQAYYKASLDDMSRLQAFVAGTPEQCAERLAAYADAGVRHFVIRIGSLDALPHLGTVAEIADAVRKPVSVR
jgi:alkanesulfonate monooxygenase SsuD/methylene tetrahydromethanopterin reductase-like flavin-dependent oxidoreductase (luciferase family)